MSSEIPYSNLTYGRYIVCNRCGEASVSFFVGSTHTPHCGGTFMAPERAGYAKKRAWIPGFVWRLVSK